MSHPAARFIPRHPATLALAVLLLAGACGGDSTGSNGPEPDVAKFLIVLPGPVLITVTPACGVTGGPMRFTYPGPALDAQFSVRRADDTPDPLVTADDFEVQAGPAAGIVTAASTGSFSASFTPHGSGAPGTVTVALRHKSRNHLDFGPCSVPVQVN